MTDAPALPSPRYSRTDAATYDQRSEGRPCVAASCAPAEPGSQTSPIRVISKHTASQYEKDQAVYVGRGSVLGNPFKVQPYGSHERGTTLPLFERHLRERLAQKHPPICADGTEPGPMNRLYTLAGEARAAGRELLVMCFARRLDRGRSRPVTQTSSRKCSTSSCSCELRRRESSC